MNSGRTKYTSTPTYGRQKRGFGKRQTQTNPDLDFTQKPTPDFDMPVTGSPDPYGMPQGIYHNPVPQQGNTPPQAYPVQSQGMGGAPPFSTQPAGMQSAYTMNAPAFNTPFTGTPMPQIPPLANTGAKPPVNANGRMQGYVPPSVLPADQIAAPVMQANPEPQGMAYPQYGQPQYAAQPLYSAQPQAGQPNGMNGYPGFPGDGMPPEQTPGKPPKPPVNIDNWLKMLLYIILPLVFVLCIALRDEGFNILRYLFMTASAASVGMLWYRQSFTSSLRTGVTIGYGLMCLVMVVMMLTGPNSDIVKPNTNITAAPTTVITEEPTDEALGYQPDQAPQATTPVEIAPEDTDEGVRLSAFMDNWKKNDIQAMLEYVMPTWRSSKTDPATSLFIIIANRTPLDYTIEYVSGVSGDTSRSVTMSATIDKNNGNDPLRYRFVILMDKEEGDWYVDPNSLSTNEVDPTDTPIPDNIDALYTEAPRMTVTPVPPDDTPLYYNSDGGKYYHADPNCSSVNSKYLPMTSFTYGELGESPFDLLRPCLKCNAPTK